jgi:hypothetical protein
MSFLFPFLIQTGSCLYPPVYLQEDYSDKKESMSIPHFFVADPLILLLLPQYSGAQVIGPPCCAPQKFAMKLMANLDSRPDEPFDVEATWLFSELDKVDRTSLLVLSAALDGYCAATCSKRFAVAKAVVASLLSERSRTEEQTFKWGDRWFGLLYAVIAAIATLVSTAAIIVFSRAESRNEQAIRALVQQLSLRNDAAQPGNSPALREKPRRPVI